MRRRHHYAPEPFSRLAVWARRLAFFALAVALLSVIVLRGDFVEMGPGLVIFGAALACGLAGIVCGVGALAVIWFEGRRGLGRALFAIAAGLLLMAYPAYIAITGYGTPRISDVTTDTADPPAFDAIARLRPRNANPVAYQAEKYAARQREAYPQLATLVLDAAPEAVHNTVVDILLRRKWRVVDARAPQAGRRDGLVEVVLRTPLMGFRDDVVIRTRAQGNATRVDIRAAARFGDYDFGANAERVRALLEEIEEAVDTQEEPAATR